MFWILVNCKWYQYFIGDTLSKSKFGEKGGSLMAGSEPQMIIPRYKMIMLYDIQPGRREMYYEFVLGEFVPALQEMGIYIAEAWQTAHGEHPDRMASFVAEDYDTIEDAINSRRWFDLDERFRRYVTNYTLKIVPYRPGFQFIIQNN